MIKHKEEENPDLKRPTIMWSSQGGEEKKAVHVTIWLHTLDDFQTLCEWWNTFSFPCNSRSKVIAVMVLFQRKLRLVEVTR